MDGLKRRVASLYSILQDRDGVVAESEVLEAYAVLGHKLASASVRRGETVQIMAYENSTFTVEVTMPCDPAAIEEAADLAEDIVNVRLENWLDKVKPGWRDE